MKTEREAFDLWFKKKFHDLHEAICCGDLVAKNYKKAMFKSWCASSQREGYKLVPLETLEEALSWANCASSESWGDEQREEIDKHYGVIEKAMIGVSE